MNLNYETCNDLLYTVISILDFIIKHLTKLPEFIFEKILKPVKTHVNVAGYYYI